MISTLNILDEVAWKSLRLRFIVRYRGSVWSQTRARGVPLYTPDDSAQAWPGVYLGTVLAVAYGAGL